MADKVIHYNLLCCYQDPSSIMYLGKLPSLSVPCNLYSFTYLKGVVSKLVILTQPHSIYQHINFLEINNLFPFY